MDKIVLKHFLYLVTMTTCQSIPDLNLCALAGRQGLNRITDIDRTISLCGQSSLLTTSRFAASQIRDELANRYVRIAFVNPPLCSHMQTRGNVSSLVPY